MANVDGDMMGKLQEGLRLFSLDTAIISCIVGDKYTVIESAYVEGGMDLQPGTEFELGMTYCQDVVLSKATKYYQDVAAISGMEKHPCYVYTQLRSYIASPIFVGGDLWGTVNFSSLQAKRVQYTASEVAYIEQMATDIALLIEKKGQ